LFEVLRFDRSISY